MNKFLSKYILTLIILFGCLLINAQKIENFEKTYKYTNGIAFLKNGIYWGAIDNKGEVIIPFKYDSIYFNDDEKFIIVKKKDKLGLYNLEGHLISKAKYTWYSFDDYFVNGVHKYEPNIIARYGQRGEFRTIGKITTKGKFVQRNKPIIPVYHPKKGEFAVIKTKKKWYIYRNDSLIKFRSDFDTLIIPRCEDKGKTQIYLVSNKSTFRWSKTKNRKKYHKLKHVTSSHYAAHGKLIARKNNLYGIIDSSGKVIEFYNYDKVGDFYLGFAKVIKDGKYGLVNYKGYLIGDLKYDDIVLNYYHCFGHCWGSYYYYFESGREKEKVKVKTSEGWGFINTKGEEICKTFYDTILPFENNLALVMKNDKWGVIDKDCKEILPVAYDSITRFADNNMARVMRNGKWGVVDDTNKEVIPLIYENVFFVDKCRFSNYTKQSSKKFQIKSDGRFLTIDLKGNIIKNEDEEDCY